jgi:hypothetical protein
MIFQKAERFDGCDVLCHDLVASWLIPHEIAIRSFSRYLEGHQVLGSRHDGAGVGVCSYRSVVFRELLFDCTIRTEQELQDLEKQVACLTRGINPPLLEDSIPDSIKKNRRDSVGHEQDMKVT